MSQETERAMDEHLNRHFTWRELATRIEQMTDEQKDTDVTVLLAEADEFFAAEGGVRFTGEGEVVLDPDHPYIKIPC